jgi:diacylglycerol kinase family enzyme
MEIEIAYSESREKVVSPFVVFNNTAFVAGGFAPSPTANPYDGKLDCTIFYDQTFSRFFQTGVQMKTGRRPSAKVKTISAESFSVESSEPLRLQVDGEIMEVKGGVRFSVLPSVLKVFVRDE